MLATIPIFITARGNNDVKIRKNTCALKFSYVFIKNMGLLDQTYIISDNKDMLSYATKLGFVHTLYSKCETDKEVKYIEYNTIYNFHKKYNIYPDWFILLSIDQIFINSELIKECIKNIDNKYDVITTYTEISNKCIFFLNDDNLFETVGHKMTNERDRRKMADGAIYAIKSSYAIQCMEQEDPAEHFWNGKFKFFKNLSIYTDINEVDDIDKFFYIDKIIKEVKAINI